MAHLPSFLLKVASRLSGVLFALVLAFLISSKYGDSGARSPTPALLARETTKAPGLDGVDSYSNVSVTKRDEYSCGPGKPCFNGACCGASGYCGYGSTYCGAGCVSNCDATAECGQYAKVPGTTCPLNTW